MEYLGFSLYKIMLSENRYNLTSSLNVIFFLSNLFCLIDFSVASSTVLNKSNYSGHPCLIPDIKGKAFKSHGSAC